MKWVIAFCLLLAALALAVVSIQEASLNSQLDARQRELGYTSKNVRFTLASVTYPCCLLPLRSWWCCLPLRLLMSRNQIPSVS